jgi:hypothetical protein
MPPPQREKMGTAYSVPRRTQCHEKRDSLRRRVDRAGCPHFFAPSTNAVLPTEPRPQGAVLC